MIVHLVDGTYELYRQHYGQAVRSSTPAPNAATIGVLNSTLQLLQEGATYIGVATDHVIESFRNDLWDGYKTSEGMEPEILTQIPIVEEALRSMGVTVWAMEEFEADDALASAAAVAAADPKVTQVRILSPDKDLGQCVVGDRVVQIDRRKMSKGEDGLVNEAADGFPGLAGWGAKSAAAVLARYGHIEDIPDAAGQWDVPGLRGAPKLAASLSENRELALLFRRIATTVDTVPVGTVAEWHWDGPTADFADFCDDLGVPRLAEKAAGLARSRGR
jgi:5'-3' exonuclease